MAITPYRDTLGPRQRAIFDSQASQAASLLNEAQMRAANPEDRFNLRDIQSLKSDFFSTTLGSPHSGVLAQQYGTQFSNLEANTLKAMKDHATIASSNLLAEKTKFDMRRKRDEILNTRIAEQKYDQLSQEISSVLESGAHPHEMSSQAYTILMEDPSFLRTATGKKLHDLTTQAISRVTNDAISDVGTKLLDDAIRSGTPEAIDEAGRALGIEDSPLLGGAKDAAKAKRDRDSADDARTALTAEVTQLEKIVRGSLDEDATWENMQSAGKALLETANKLGLTGNESFKSFSDWLLQDKPPKAVGLKAYQSGQDPLGDGKNKLYDLMIDVQRRSLIPGGRIQSVFDPSKRSGAAIGLGNALIPSRAT